MFYKSGGDCVNEEETTPLLYSDDSLEDAAKRLNAAVQRRHQHMRISCNTSSQDGSTASVRQSSELVSQSRTRLLIFATRTLDNNLKLSKQEAQLSLG